MAPLRAAAAAATAGSLLAAVLPLVAAAVAVSRPAIPLVTSGSSSFSTTGNDRIFQEGRGQYVFEPLLSSSWARDRKFLRQLQEPLCRPRTMLVSVAPPDAAHGATFSPDRVQVTRCAGACGTSRKACVATAVSTARVAVVLMASDRNATAGHVLVQRHDACACGCATQPRHCSERQEYIAAECRCGCRARLHAEAQRCIAQPHFVWDDRSCRCACQHPASACAPGNVWVPDLCQCRPFLQSSSDITKNSYNIAKQSP